MVNRKVANDVQRMKLTATYRIEPFGGAGPAWEELYAITVR